jgi:hypothetical protein
MPLRAAGSVRNAGEEDCRGRAEVMRQPNKEEYARDDRAEGESDTHPFLGRHRDETGV